MVDEKLLDFTYYYNKLPLYLQQSEGFVEHFKYWIEILQKLDVVGDELSNMFNVFDENYLEKNLNCSDFLDKIGLLYGVNRNITIGDVTYNLNDKVFLLLIKAQITKNFYNGTYSDLNTFYYDVAKIPLTYYTTSSMTVEIILSESFLSSKDYSPSEIAQVSELFKAGYLTIESLGVKYNKKTINEKILLMWNNVDALWNVKVWG